MVLTMLRHAGLLSLAHSTSVFVENYHRLPSVVKSYGLLLLWDWCVVSPPALPFVKAWGCHG